jgi:glycogen operon protein
MATLLLSQGVPMICSGDELSHTQSGNNNSYCQDNELTWLNWQLDGEKQEFLAFVRQVTLLWRTQPVFQRRRFFQGRGIRGSSIKDISWLDPSGQDMSDEAWNTGFIRCVGLRLAGDLIGDLNEHGEPIVGETLLILLNAHHEGIPFTLPLTKAEHRWERVLDTADSKAPPEFMNAGHKYQLQGRSLTVLRISLKEPPPQPAVSAVQVGTLLKEQKTAPVYGERPAVVTGS